jgi:hypothetical protein
LNSAKAASRVPGISSAACAGAVTGQALPAGHFIPEELPLETAHALAQFFAETGA